MVNFNQAIANFTETIKLNPNLAIAYYDRGIEYLCNDYYDPAIQDFNQALQINPNLTAV
jgi:tetratricopeptide (TPR) repeat protein